MMIQKNHPMMPQKEKLKASFGGNEAQGLDRPSAQMLPWRNAGAPHNGSYP